MDEHRRTNILWAIVDKDGNIMFSRGGSSSKEKLMVYDKELSARRALSNCWTKQVVDRKEVMIKVIYKKLRGE